MNIMDPITIDGTTAFLFEAEKSPKQNLCRVYCNHCKKDHLHGWPKDIKNGTPEFRRAHCIDGPYAESGYFISANPHLWLKSHE